MVALAGADAVGLNFYPESPRFIDSEAAEKIVAVLPDRIAKVGIFVNASADEVLKTSDRLKLDWIQLHGDEPPETLVELGSRSVVRAFRFGQDGYAEIAQYLEACQRAARLPEAVLVDARREGEFGGTGETVEWSAVDAGRTAFGNLPLVLAGGLTPFNVSEAIAAAKPIAVDTASGVESKPGNKDPMLVRAFVNAARKAFEALASTD